MIREFFERLTYEGLTYEEVCKAAGGGKSGQVAPERPVDFITNTMTGMDKIGKTRGEDMAPSKASDVSTKKMGTRGLQIPLQAEAATPQAASAPTTGVNI